MTWPEVKIGSFCDTGSGGTPSRDRASEFYGGPIPWVKSGELRESIISQTEETITEAGLANSSAKIVPPGALLVAMYGATVGRVGILGIRAATNQAVCHIVPRGQSADTRYLFHCLQAKLPVFLNRSVGGAQPNISQEIVKDTSVPLPPLEEQRRIAAILDKADALRQNRRAALLKLDSLTQSFFLDMFGDPATNPKRWAIATIGELLESASYGSSEKAGGTGTYAMLRMNNLTVDGRMDLSELKYIDLPIGQEERWLVRIGDLLFNRTNSPELVGKTAVFRHSVPMAYAGYLVRLRVNQESTPEYISAFLNSKYGKATLRGMGKSIIGMANINATEVQTIRIPKPPKSLQETFARLVLEVELHRERQLRSSAALDNQFEALQYRAFDGGL